MSINIKLLIASLGVGALAFGGCSSGEHADDHGSMRMAAPDAVTAAPELAMVAAETEFARAVIVTVPPGGVIPTHHHRGGAAVYALKGGTVRVHRADDTTSDMEISTGSGMFADMDTPSSVENTGADTVQVLVLDRIPGTELPALPADQSPDAVTASPDNYRTVAENDAFRIVRMTVPAGGRDEWHSHPNELVHFLVGAAGRIHMPDGESMDIEVPAGATMFMPATVSHSVEGIGGGPIEAVIIEMKPAM